MSPVTNAPFSETRLLGQAQEADPRQQKSTVPKPFLSRRQEDITRQVQSNSSFLQRRLQSGRPEMRRFVEINAAVMHGNPVFSGTRIPIYQIVEELSDGANVERIREAYPSLTAEKILAGLDFASSLLRIYDDQALDR